MSVFIIFAILAIVAFIIFAFVFMYQLRTYEKPLEEETPEPTIYKYRTPFDNKLIELGVKEKWDVNYGIFTSKGTDAEKFKSGKERANTFSEFIILSFWWSTSNEGFDFWNEISKK